MSTQIDIDSLKEAAEKVEALSKDNEAHWVEIDRAWRVYRRVAIPSTILALLERLNMFDAERTGLALRLREYTNKLPSE